MHLVSDKQGAPLESVDELVEFFHAAGKPSERWRIGTEHEMCGVYRSDGSAPAYDGGRGIRAILDALSARGWKPVFEGEAIIALTRGDSQVTIEPGGQFEHAARPVTEATELTDDLKAFVGEVCAPSKTHDLKWLALGFRPFGQLEDVPWMPKERYAVMREYLPTRGGLAREMMQRTATVQVNLDYSDAQDAAAKMRAAMGATSLITALYANSPIVNGEDSGFQTYRAEIWRDTDPDRCGLLPFVFDGSELFASYTQWALDVPMFFVYREHYRPAGGMTFRKFMKEGWNGFHATMDDWTLHLSTLFPEVRLKAFMELRGCDTGRLDMVVALGPLSRGLLYDDTSRRAATELTAHLTLSQREELRETVPRQGLLAKIPGTTHLVADYAKELMDIAVDGVRRLVPAELPLLDPLLQIAEDRRTRADTVIEIWKTYKGNTPALVDALAYPEFSVC